jgi:hypothetical protein
MKENRDGGEREINKITFPGFVDHYGIEGIEG